MKFVRVTDSNSKEDMYINLNTILAVRKNSSTKGTSIMLSNGTWLEVVETIPEFAALIEDRDPSIAKLLFRKEDIS